MIREALTSEVIDPGITTEKDIGMFLKSKTDAIGATIPFISVVADPQEAMLIRVTG